ncbi:NXPE family member 3-like [Carassius auratus]|uniref:NXPE family member 3-like n=1 Tax=Carassius auratus TaxID=7957 RepID=A0A6P6J4Y9_CARAU|nr:NXPE family member 3-like [Carassius auratus]XP_052445324.1 NXPE family member 3-like isoform X1 [Carassius gibelio]
MGSNTQVYGLRKYVFFTCSIWITFCLSLWQMNCFQIRKFHLPSPKQILPKNSSLTISASEMGISDEEWESLQKALDWPGPDLQITLDLSTSPVHSTFSTVEPKKSYKVGDNISVIITARDHNKNLKRYGGDFFKAKLFNSQLKASVYGEVVDHRNGTYSAVLLLPWEGQAQVFVRLEHSSEVVQILKKYRESSFPRSHYKGYFGGAGPNKTRISEVVECNIKWGEGSWSKSNCCCEYKDIKTGTVWQCERPKKLPCDKLVYHSKGGLENPLNTFEKQFFAKTLTNVRITGDTQIINILPNTAGNGTRERCRSGLKTPVPAGFYLKDVWKSFVCNTQQFDSAQMLKCLQNKIVYMIGDSTTRQWFEFFESKVPGLKRMNLQTRSYGPLMAVELKNNVIIHWRPHGVPLRFSVMPITNLHYISNVIDNIAGGPHVVVVFTIFAHLVFHPLTFYVHEVAKIRQSVVALLSRAPQTTIVIKSGNTAGYKDIFQSDWYTLQENIVMKEMFRDIDGVIYFDIWQMTSCHYLTENIHPGPVVIANAISVFLSYVCPV